ncbi:MAG: glycosyltransferase family 39 protein [Deltaproteobacteria bacterium]|nr:glycosyltransferase family 39 protein [Deltaproteobacteria bacterium]
MTRSTRAFVLVLTVYFAVQVAGLFLFGLTDDDDYYIPAGISYARWIGSAFTGLSRAAVDAAFNANHEHPPVAKYVFGICHFALRGVLGPFRSARFGTVLFSTLVAAAMLWIARAHLGERRGLVAGGAAVAMLLTLPRFFFHSHAATLDVPVTALYLLAATLALMGERSVRLAVLAGPVFGLATATKLNAPFLLLAYVPFVLLVRRARVLTRDGIQLPPIPLALISMGVLGPLVFFAVWPWIWFDTVARVSAYVAFHAKHYGIHFLYFGQVYTDAPFAPWHAPFVMAATTTPLATLALAALGSFVGARMIRARLSDLEGPDSEARREGDFVLFVALNALTTIGLVALAGTPIYGGEKLFMPFFPFLCLLAGYGALVGIEALGSSKNAMLLAGALSLSGIASQLAFGEYALSSYNGLIGGARGATARGLERQYYDVAFLDLVRWLSREAPKGTRIHFLPNNWEYVRTYRWYREAGMLRADLRVVDRPEEADWVVLTHERRFARYADDLLRYRTAKVLRESVVRGTPIWTVVDPVAKP